MVEEKEHVVSRFLPMVLRRPFVALLIGISFVLMKAFHSEISWSEKKIVFKAQICQEWHE